MKWETIINHLIDEARERSISSKTPTQLKLDYTTKKAFEKELLEDKFIPWLDKKYAKNLTGYQGLEIITICTVNNSVIIEII